MGRTLLVTNDFPPTVGGIQSYLRDFVSRMDPASIVVFASTQDREAAHAWDSSVPYVVERWPHAVMLPTPGVRARMCELISRYNIDTVWFGAAAPLAVLGAAAKRAGAHSVVATTHGHEVGWSMIPGARQILRRIGESADVVTYISRYTLRRFRSAFGDAPDFVRLPSGVDIERFKPIDEAARAEVRRRFGYGEEPIIVCVSRLVARKGQDRLIDVMPRIHATHPTARLILIGRGAYEKRLRARIDAIPSSAQRIHIMGELGDDELRDLLAASDVFAMPARTRGGGLDVEGLGIVYLEAQACGLPVVAGNSGGAPETVTESTGIVVDGRDVDEIAEALLTLLGSTELRRRMGDSGRDHVVKQWTWEVMSDKARKILGQPHSASGVE